MKAPGDTVKVYTYQNHKGQYMATVEVYDGSDRHNTRLFETAFYGGKGCKKRCREIAEQWAKDNGHTVVV